MKVLKLQERKESWKTLTCLHQNSKNQRMIYLITSQLDVLKMDLLPFNSLLLKNLNLSPEVLQPVVKHIHSHDSVLLTPSPKKGTSLVISRSSIDPDDLQNDYYMTPEHKLSGILKSPSSKSNVSKKVIFGDNLVGEAESIFMRIKNSELSSAELLEIQGFLCESLLNITSKLKSKNKM
jgi:hypothetical protein